MAPYDARMVANYLLDLADAKKRNLTQAALLKILYFCHGWYLVWKNKPLSANDFEAWEYGPVVRVVREAFRSNGKRPIQTRAQRFNLRIGMFEEISNIIEANDLVFIEKIFDYYCRFSTSSLIEMTHEKGSPWDKLWNSPEPVARLGLRIKDEEIRAHFLKGERPKFMI